MLALPICAQGQVSRLPTLTLATAQSQALEAVLASVLASLQESVLSAVSMKLLMARELA